jgi:hypothetical protein
MAKYHKYVFDTDARRARYDSQIHQYAVLKPAAIRNPRG